MVVVVEREAAGAVVVVAVAVVPVVGAYVALVVWPESSVVRL